MPDLVSYIYSFYKDLVLTLLLINFLPFRQVMEVIAAVRNESTEQLAEQIYMNTHKLFFPEDAQ